MCELPPDLQILYYDGQFDDARLNVMLATSAAAAGAAVANYVEATGLIKVSLRQHALCFSFPSCFSSFQHLTESRRLTTSAAAAGAAM